MRRRTLERVKEVAPILAELDIAFAMTMPPDIDDQEEQFGYYSEVIRILTEHGVGPMLYARPEHPMTAGTLERLMDVGEVPGVKLAHNGLLLTYAEMVQRLGHDRSAWYVWHSRAGGCRRMRRWERRGGCRRGLGMRFRTRR